MNIQKIFKLILLFSIITISSCSVSYRVNQIQKLKLMEAETLFKEAFNKESAEKIEYFERSANLLEEFVEENNIDNGYIYYNIANAWFYSGQLGKAILNYKKAEKRLPANINIKTNLAFARSKVLNRINSPKDNPLLRTIFFIHYDLSFKNRIIIFLIFLIFESFCGILIIYRKKIFKNLLIINSILMILISFSLIVDISKRQEGVIIAKEVIARKGDSNGYESSFTSPLNEGLEFILISERIGWYQIELQDGKSCWVPDYSVLLLD